MAGIDYIPRIAICIIVSTCSTLLHANDIAPETMRDTVDKLLLGDRVQGSSLEWMIKHKEDATPIVKCLLVRAEETKHLGKLPSILLRLCKYPEYRGNDVLERLMSLLDEKASSLGDEGKAEAIRCLAYFPVPEVVEKTVSFLADGIEGRIRLSAAQVLVKQLNHVVPGKEMRDYVKKLFLEEKDLGVKVYLAKALGEIAEKVKGKEEVEYLKSVLSDTAEDSSVRQVILELMFEYGLMSEDERQQTILKLLGGDDPRLGETAARLLYEKTEKLGGDEVDKLMLYVGKSDGLNKWIISLIGEKGDKRGTEKMLEIAKSNNPKLQRYCMGALTQSACHGQLSNEQIGDIQSLHDSPKLNSKIKDKLLVVLGYCGSDSVKSDLAEGLDNRKIAYHVVEILRQPVWKGKADKALVEGLIAKIKRSKKTKSQYVALKNITGIDLPNNIDEWETWYQENQDGLKK